MDIASSAFSAKAELSLIALLIGLAVGLGLSLLTQWHFKKFASTLSNKAQFARNFPLITLTTVLIISIVKSSLALSLGLVGALSIVRFRTPIKEPEELAYLFLCIAVGLGLGADQLVPTTLATLTILGASALIKFGTAKNDGKNLYLSLSYTESGEQASNVGSGISNVLAKHTKRADLRRFDANKDRIEAVYLVDVPSTTGLSNLVSDLRTSYPAMSVVLIDQNQIPAI